MPILFPSPDSSFFILFIYIGRVLFNNGMTTLSCIIVKVLPYCQATIAVVVLELELPPLLHLVPHRPMGWLSQCGAGKNTVFPRSQGIGLPSTKQVKAHSPMRLSARYGCRSLKQEVKLSCLRAWVLIAASLASWL